MPDEAALNRSPPTPHRRRTAGAQRSLSWLITIAIFLLIFRRIPYQKLIAALGEADYDLGRGALAAYRAASSGCHSCRSAAPSSSCC